MKIGDILFPIPTEKRQGQLILPWWGNNPILIVGWEHYESCDPADCQSEGEDMRWLVYENGDLLSMTTFMVEQLYECR